jgi:hypothetical protein
VPAADVIFLGDGEFDGVKLQEKLDEFGWKYACRTSSNTILYDGEEFSFQDLVLQPGMCLSIQEVVFTRQRYGPVLAVAWWRKNYQEPIYLVSNMDLVEEVCHWYQRRFKIETFFSDQKSRGFNLHKSHFRPHRGKIDACALAWPICGSSISGFRLFSKISFHWSIAPIVVISVSFNSAFVSLNTC